MRLIGSLCEYLIMNIEPIRDAPWCKVNTDLQDGGRRNNVLTRQPEGGQLWQERVKGSLALLMQVPQGCRSHHRRQSCVHMVMPVGDGEDRAQKQPFDGNGEQRRPPPETAIYLVHSLISERTHNRYSGRRTVPGRQEQ